MEERLRILFYGSMVAFGSSESISVAFPNINFDDSQLTQYLRVDTLPTEPQVRGIKNGWSQYRWILQVRVYAKDGVGELKPLRVADDLGVHLPAASELVGGGHTFTVIKPPTPLPPVADDGWFFVPVQMQVQTIH